MDQPNSTIAPRPPCFVPPPSPISDNNLANAIAINHDFILQCINKEREKAAGKQDTNHDTTSSCTDLNNNDRNLPHPVRKRARINHVWRSKNGPFNIIGILRNNNFCRQTTYATPATASFDHSDIAWHDITIHNNNSNFVNQERWRGILAYPIKLSRDNRSGHCSTINENWTARYAQTPSATSYFSDKAIYSKRVQISLPQPNLPINVSSMVTHGPMQSSKDENKENHASRHKKRTRASSANKTKKDNPNMLNDVKANLHSRAERKITRIATWNINNGFDHLAIASIMAKNDIDILALQEPRISHSTIDDVWISTMRKELRKCKYEIITSQFSYIIFDEQTSGAALASIIRQNSKVHGRLLSVTFKSNDVWEVHTVISLYAVTNAKSGKRYANTRNSRRDVNLKLTKALLDEIHFLQETYGNAPITVVGDFQDTIHSDWRDNIGLVGRKMHSNSPLHMLLNLGFQSAYHLLYPNQEQVTRWNGSQSAGRHIDLQMLNDAAAKLLLTIKIDNKEIRNYITSDHLIVTADYNIEKVEQCIIDSYRTKINFRKIAGIKMKCEKKITKCSLTSMDKANCNLVFDTNQFMSSMVQDQLKMLEKWQHEANSSTMNDVLTMLEQSMQALENDIAVEDGTLNAAFDFDSSTTQRKLVLRNPERRAHLNGVYNAFQKALYQIAVSLKFFSIENKHVDALCMRQAMKNGTKKALWREHH